MLETAVLSLPYFLVQSLELSFGNVAAVIVFLSCDLIGFCAF